MAQLSADRDDLMPLEEAQALLRRLARPQSVSHETVPLDAALGRILAEPLLGQRLVPPFDNSAVDGYAFALDQAEANQFRLQLAGRVAAGEAAPQLLPGTAQRLMTGAPIPQGADTVMMEEDAQLEGNVLTLSAGLKRGANLRPAGEDVALGQDLLPNGTQLRPPHLGLAASQGLETLKVAQKPRLALVSTGDELVRGQLADSNGPLLAALGQAAGAQVRARRTVPDQLDALTQTLHTLSDQADLIVTSGGVSLSEADQVRRLLESQGEPHILRVAIKPGRPLMFARLAGAWVLALPGNPVAAYVTARLFLVPLIQALQGQIATSPPLQTHPLGFAHKKKRGRREYLRVRLNDQGQLHKYATDGAGILSGLAWAEGLAILKEDQERLEPGTHVNFLPFEGSLL